MQITSFNRGWRFYNDIHSTGVTEVNLPHDAMQTEKRLPNMKNGAAAGFFPGGRYVYTKMLYGEESYRDRTVLLEFGGIYMKSSVYLNDEWVGGWIYGYTGFYVDLTDKLKIGEENEIRVIADNTQTPNSRWYTGSGIYRDVNLLVGDKKHIIPDGVSIVTKSIDPVMIQVTTEVSAPASGLQIQVEVYEEAVKDTAVATGTGSDCQIEIPDAKLWSAEHPNLYLVKVKLMENGRTVDVQETITGIRILRWSAEKGMQINGKEVKLRGGCIHHDNGILGARAFKKAEYRKIRILKENGFNAIRSAHNPAGRELLAACDRLGMYVMDEAFDQWRVNKTDYDYALYFDEEWEKDITALVKKDRNHPSVLMYSIGNEIADTGMAGGAAISRMLTECCHRLDPSRPTVNGINPVVSNMGGALNSKTKKEDVVDPYLEKKNSQATASLLANMIATAAPFISKMMGRPDKVEKLLKPCFNEIDIVGYNYAENCYEPHHQWEPGRIMVGSETYPQSLAERWTMIEKSSFVIGDFMWTAMDYLGEAGIGVPIYGKARGEFNRPYPCVSGGCGVIDLIGHADTEAYHAAIVWGQYHKPYIAVRPVNHSMEKYFFGMWRGTDAVASWTWPGMEGRIAEVEIYSEGCTIELFQDGISLGKQVLQYCKAKYKVAYRQGELKAVSYNETGDVLAEELLCSAGEETKLTVMPEETLLKADGDDMTFVSVSLTDDHGIEKMLCDRKVNVKVSGAGELAAIGSGNPVTVESFTGNSYTTWFGRMGFYVRSTGMIGKAYVEISAPDVEVKTLELEFE